MSNSTSLELDAVIYRNEFEQYRKGYLETKTDNKLILTFLFLQIYGECFLHQNMRRVVEMEFKPPRQDLLVRWRVGEKRYVPEKIDNFSGLFYAEKDSPNSQLIDTIKDRLNKIGSIRNRFAHGHKVATYWDSFGGTSSTPAKLLLTEKQLNQSIAEVNEMGLAWNELLDNVQLQFQALRSVVDFKFIKI